MSLSVLVQLVTTLPLCGLIWLVQIVVYPQFAGVGASEFSAYHAAHARRITWVVGPLMVGELLAAAAWLVGGASLLSVAGIALVGVAWGVTALVSVPLHDRLSTGFDPGAHARLVATNWLRTIAWSARAPLVIAAALGHR